MLDQHNHLFLADKASKTRIVRIIWIGRQNMRLVTRPMNILGLGKQILHESFLARNLHLNMALTKTTITTSGSVILIAVDGGYSFIQVDELNIAVKSLACDSLHDNVDWLVFLLADDSCVATKEGKDLWAVDTVRNLSRCQYEVSVSTTIDLRFSA